MCSVEQQGTSSPQAGPCPPVPTEPPVPDAPPGLPLEPALPESAVHGRTDSAHAFGIILFASHLAAKPMIRATTTMSSTQLAKRGCGALPYCAPLLKAMATGCAATQRPKSPSTGAAVQTEKSR